MRIRILLLTVMSGLFLFSAVLYSAEPLVKFYLNDGSTKQYNLSEIDSLGVIDKKNNYVMRIHYNDSLIAYYPTEIIGRIKFENDSLNVYIFSYPKPYLLSSIDSLVFYIDQWQPLTIGSQVWMLKNLNVDHYRNGDSILIFRKYGNWDTIMTGATCWYDDLDYYGPLVGRLYNWYAVNDARILSPIGWHVPSDSEFIILQQFLGGISVAGGKMKRVNGVAWDTWWWEPNTGATNESGFTARASGCRANNNNYSSMIEYCFLWSSTERSSTEAGFWFLFCKHAGFDIDITDKYKGFSVRCVKDGK